MKVLVFINSWLANMWLLRTISVYFILFHSILCTNLLLSFRSEAFFYLGKINFISFWCDMGLRLPIYIYSRQLLSPNSSIYSTFPLGTCHHLGPLPYFWPWLFPWSYRLLLLCTLTTQAQRAPENGLQSPSCLPILPYGWGMRSRDGLELAIYIE